MELEGHKPAPTDQPEPAEEPGRGTTFTVNLGEIELTEEEANAILSDITRAAMRHLRSS